MKWWVRVHWSAEQDWSGSEETDEPGDALAKVAMRIAIREKIPLTELYRRAMFTVRLEPPTP